MYIQFHSRDFLTRKRVRMRLAATTLRTPARASCAATMRATPRTVVDAHVHVWPDASTFAYEQGKTPPCPGAHDRLIQEMDANGVRAALIVQPINLGFDHTYVEEAIRAHPGRFVGMALANPASASGTEDVRALLASGTFRGVRFNPALWPEGEGMDGAIGKAMLRACAEATPPAVAGFMCFHGLHLHLDAIRALCAYEPRTPVLIDHFGFTKGVDDANFESLLQLGRDFEQVSVKCSAHFRVRVETTDGTDSTRAQLEKLLEVYGSDRLVWGSDYPFVTMEEGGYAGAVAILGEQLSNNPDALAKIRGENFLRLFPGALDVE